MEGAGAIARHCAYCFNVCGSPAKLCGGCLKRAYCSKECQVADWSSSGNGQRHVKWCRRHECGEEDVDWEVVPVPNKGLGVRAKKLIPAGLKIIVEPVFSSPDGHPGIQDLEPEGGTFIMKQTQNVFLGENMEGLEGEKAIALRIARVNHSCQPNAASIYDETAHVAILFAQKDIQPGEEISVCYYSPFNSTYEPKALSEVLPSRIFEEELAANKNSILSLHGITCPTDCSCNDPVIRELVREAREIYLSTIGYHYRKFNFEEALAAGDKLLDIHRRLNISWAQRALAEILLFKVAVAKSMFLPRAMKHIRVATEILQKICPYSESITKECEKLLEQPETYEGYLAFDQARSADVFCIKCMMYFAKLGNFQ